MYIRYLLSILFLQIFIVAPSFGMNAWRSTYSKFCTASHWALSVGPFWWSAYSSIKDQVVDDEKMEHAKKISKEFKDIYTNILDTHLESDVLRQQKQFISNPKREIPFYTLIEKELHKQDPNKKISLYIIPVKKVLPGNIDNDSWSAASFYTFNKENYRFQQHGALFVPLLEDEELINFLQGEDYKKVDQGSVQHEIAHLVYSHGLKSSLSLVVLPLCTHVLLKCIKIQYMFLKGSIAHKPSILQDTLKIPSAGMKASLTGLGYLWYRKYQEMEADGAIDPDILPYQIFRYTKNLEELNNMRINEPEKVMSFYVEYTNKEIPALLRPLVENNKQSIAYAMQKLDCVAPRLVEELFMDPHHPWFTRRIALLEKRLKQSENQKKSS